MAYRIEGDLLVARGMSASGSVLAGDGDASTPGLAFLTDDDTGFYLASVGRIGLTFGGTAGYTFRNTEFWPTGTSRLGRTSDPWSEIWGTSAEGAETVGPSNTGYDLTVTGTNAGAYAIGVDSSLLTLTSASATDLMTTLVQLQGAITDAASGSLQAAYNSGNSITLASSVAVELTSSGLNEYALSMTDGTNQSRVQARQIQMNNGASTRPAYGFFADTNSGMYSLGGDQVGIAAGNINVAIFANTAFNPQLLINTGSSTAPGLAFEGREGTGMRATVNTINWSINGSEEIILGTTYIRPNVDAGLSLGLSTVGWSAVYGRQSGGAESSPTYTWAADTNTGMYRPDADIVGITAGGVDVVRFLTTASNPQALFATGTAANPSITFAADSTDGFFRPADNSIGWTVASVERTRINDTQILHVAAGSTTSPTFGWLTETNTGIYKPTTSQVGIVGGGDEVARFARNSGSPQIRVTEDGTAANPPYVWVNDTNTGLFRPIDGWDATGVGVSVQGNEVVRFENDNAWDDGKVIVTQDFIAPTAVEQVWQVTSGSGVFVDETTDATSLAQGDWNVFPVSGTIGAYAAFGMSRQFDRLIFDNTGGTPGAGQPGITWQYWSGAGWSDLTVVDDEVSKFTAGPSNSQDVSWHIPSDWQQTTLNAVQKYYVRALTTGISWYSTEPVYDIVRAGGLQRGVVFNASNPTTIPSSSYVLTECFGTKLSGGLPGGTAEFRWFYADFNGIPLFDVKSTDAGTGVFTSEGNSSGVSYGFLDSNGLASEGTGIFGNASLANAFVGIALNDEEVARFAPSTSGLEHQFLSPTGSVTEPGVSFLDFATVGLYHPATNQIGIAANGEGVIVDNDSTTPSFRADVDDTWTLGEAGIRWKAIYAVTSAIGDLVMKNPDGGKQHWKLIEGHETIWLFNIQTGQKFKMAMEPVEMTLEDKQTVEFERNLYPELYGKKL